MIISELILITTEASVMPDFEAPGTGVEIGLSLKRKTLKQVHVTVCLIPPPGPAAAP